MESPPIAPGLPYLALNRGVLPVIADRLGAGMIMKRLYETAETLIYDPVPSNRNATRASLYALGFRKVELAPTLDLLQARLRSRAPDLLLAEIAGSESEVCAAIQAVRQGHLGDNPFVVIVATTWRCDGANVGLALNSGADDLIARPVSTAVLRERIKGLAERRKDFVITSDYIGPDRRREARGPGATCVEVPNPFNVRTRANLGEQEAERAIAEAVQRGKDMLNREKLRHDAMQLCLQWRMLEQTTPGGRDFREILPRIARVASEIKWRGTIAKQDAVLKPCDLVAESVQALLAMAGRIEDSGVRPVLSVLGHVVLTLGHMFAPDEVEPDGLVDLDRVMAGRSSRPVAA